ALPEPWFVYLAYNAPHAPWEDPPPELDPDPGGSVADRYDAALIGVDHELGLLLSHLDPAVRARTTIVVVGDNGTPSEVLREGEPEDEAKLSMLEGGINVPMIVAGPDVARPGSESD